MSLRKGLLFGSICFGGGLAYLGVTHWIKISQYPKETRGQLRAALRAELDGKSYDAERAYHDALSSCTERTGSSSKSTISILIKMADFYRRRNSFKRAAKIYESILPVLNGIEKVQILKALADIYSQKGFEEGKRLPQAKEILIQCANEVGEKDPSVIGPIYESLGEVLFQQKEYSDAISAYQRAADFCKLQNGIKNYLYITLMNNITSCYYAMGTDNGCIRASELAKEITSIIKTIKGDKEQNLSDLLANLQDIIKSCSP